MGIFFFKLWVNDNYYALDVILILQKLVVGPRELEKLKDYTHSF